jgi:hypothetical protein
MASASFFPQHRGWKKMSRLEISQREGLGKVDFVPLEFLGVI